MTGSQENTMISEKARKKKSTVREYIEALIIAIVVALLLRAFVIEAFKIPSGSMIPNLLVGDHIFVNKYVYGIRIPFTKYHLFKGREPKRGEMIVFIYPVDETKDFIKRVVGIPGDKIEVKKDALYVNDKLVKRTVVKDLEAGHWIEDEDSFNIFKEEINGYSYYSMYEKDTYLEEFGPVWIPEGMVFVMGDNRDHSHDSRSWGFVPEKNIKGKAMCIWLSLDKDWKSGLPIRLDRFKILH